jgi:PKD repeat protein
MIKRTFLNKSLLVCLVFLLVSSVSAFSQCEDGFCPDSIIAVELGENTWVFQLDEFCPAGSVQWRVGTDTPVIIAGIPFYYTFPGEGTYTVEATPTESDCDLGQIITTTVTIGNRSCATSIYAFRTSCERYDFLLNPTTTYSVIEWYINGELVSNANAANYIITSESEIIEVSVVYATELCTQDTLTSLVAINGCTGVCPDSIDVRFINCNVRNFTIPGFPATQNILWAFGDGVVASSENDGYQHEYAENGTYTVTATTFSDNCPEGIVLTSTVVVDGCNIIICPDNVGVVLTGSCLQVNASTNNLPGNATALWNMGDGSNLIAQTGTSLSYTYNNPGTYTVCVESTLSGCSDVNPVCTNVEVPSCGDGFCTTAFTATQLSGNTFALALINGPQDATVNWNFGDGNNLVSDGDVQYTFAALGTYTITASFTDFDCDDETVVLSQTITITGDFSGCPQSIVVTTEPTCGTYSFVTNLGSLNPTIVILCKEIMS